MVSGVQMPVYDTMGDILAQSVDVLDVYQMAKLPSTELSDGFECDSRLSC